jgi:predicted Zn-dependent protease
MPAVQNSGSTFSDAWGEGYGSPAVLTHEDALVTSSTVARQYREAWTQLIDDKLIEWGWNPQVFDDEINAPTRVALARAGQLASWMRRRNWKLPTGLIPDGEGGVVFENRQGSNYVRLEILNDGTVFFVAFKDCRLIQRDEVVID